jgi:hypothetical protein
MSPCIPPPGFRRPVRVTITVPHHTHEALLTRSDIEGRSLSNLAAYLLESALAFERSFASGNGTSR